LRPILKLSNPREWDLLFGGTKKSEGSRASHVRPSTDSEFADIPRIAGPDVSGVDLNDVFVDLIAKWMRDASAGRGAPTPGFSGMGSEGRYYTMVTPLTIQGPPEVEIRRPGSVHSGHQIFSVKVSGPLTTKNILGQILPVITQALGSGPYGIAVGQESHVRELNEEPLSPGDMQKGLRLVRYLGRGDVPPADRSSKNKLKEVVLQTVNRRGTFQVENPRAGESPDTSRKPEYNRRGWEILFSGLWGAGALAAMSWWLTPLLLFPSAWFLLKATDGLAEAYQAIRDQRPGFFAAAWRVLTTPTASSSEALDKMRPSVRLEEAIHRHFSWAQRRPQPHPFLAALEECRIEFVRQFLEIALPILLVAAALTGWGRGRDLNPKLVAALHDLEKALPVHFDMVSRAGADGFQRNSLNRIDLAEMRRRLLSAA